MSASAGSAQVPKTDSHVGEPYVELADILDIPMVQSLVEDFYAMLHMPVAILDMRGKVLVGVGWQDICTQFHRVNPESCQNCTESDTKLSAGIPPGEYRLYKCKNNMWDLATPLMLGNRHVGHIFAGQFFFEHEPLNRDLFRAQATQYGFDQEKYLAALEAVPRFSREAVDRGMRFLSKLAHVLSELTYSKNEIAESLLEREQAELALRASEERLRENEERLRAATAAAEIGVWYWRPGTSYVEVGANWRRLFGVASGVPVTFETWTNAIHPEDRGRAIAELNAASDQHREFNTEYRVPQPDGSTRWIVDRGRTYYDESGRAVSMAGINVDVTEYKRSQDALIRSEKLASVGRMAATVAHEINNPLAAVTNCIFLACSDPSLGPEAKKHLELADRELKRVAHIAKRTLGFYREHAKPAVVDIRTALDEVVDLYSPKLNPKRLRLKIEHDGRHGHTVAVAGEIRQVISNLLTNAIDASRIRGLVRMRISRVTWSGRSYVRLTIADTGTGISAADQKQIFKPFFTTKAAVGTGLGLWVSNEIVTNHHGHIRVRSAEGKGTTFSVFLPEASVDE